MADLEPEGTREIPREAFLAFVDRVEGLDDDQLVERFRLTQADAETLVPALLVYRNLLMETSATALVVPDASLRAGLLIELVGQSAESTFEEFSRQVLASAEALGEKYRYDAKHAKHVAHLAGRLFDELQAEHGLRRRDRLLLEVAALLHDIGVFVGLRAHHKHTQYLLAASEIFGLSGDDVALVSNAGTLPPAGTAAEVPPAVHGAGPGRPGPHEQARGAAPGGQCAGCRAPAEGARPPGQAGGRPLASQSPS